MPVNCVELCIKSNFSFLRGGSHPEEYAQRSLELGLEAFAITDVNSVSGVVRAHSALKKTIQSNNICKKSNFFKTRLIAGTEINTVEGLIITILAKNRKGWANICRILTQGKINEKKGSCKITAKDVINYGDQTALLLHRSNKMNHKKWMQLSKKIIKKFPTTALILSPKYEGKDFEIFKETSKIAKELNIQLAASAYPIMHHSSRRRTIDVLRAIQNKCKIEELGHRAEKNAERRIRSTTELKKIFVNYSDAIINSINIARSCTFSLDELKHQYPLEICSGETPDEKLARLTRTGLAWRYPKKIPYTVKKQVVHELKLIKKLNYSPYFLTVYDIVNFARSKNILCQGRGSAANSIVCFSLGITSVSPEIGTMVFERFVSETRNEPPDIDVDFEHERREEIIQYIYTKFGRHRTGLCSTVIHYRKKRAIREVGKAMGLSTETIAFLLSQHSGWIRPISNKKLEDARLNISNRKLTQTLTLINQIIGFPRHLGQHVGGFILTEDRLDELIPIENTSMPNRTIICWDKNDIDALGILKVDILGLGMLTCLRKAFSLINTLYSQNYDLSNIPPEDPNVYNMMCKADTIGVFQVESRAQMNFLPKMLPRCFYDLVIQIAIVRPGPIQGDMVHPYIKRRKGDESIKLPPSPLKEVLKKTLGVPLFQEQAMQIAIIGANFNAEEADDLRRSLATFKNYGNIGIFRDRFIRGMLKNGYEKHLAERCFSQIEGFSRYGFPESHAASFALIVYASAWIKLYHPEIFACALLNSQPMGFYSISQIIDDAKQHGVEIRPLCINNSLWDNTIEVGFNKNLAIRIGFRHVKGLSKTVIEHVISKRRNGFKNFDDVWFNTNLSYFTLSKLIKSDCFSELDIKRNDALWRAQKLRHKRKNTLFNDLLSRINTLEADINLPKTTTGTELIKDYKSLNFSLRSHPMALLRNIIEKEK